MAFLTPKDLVDAAASSLPLVERGVRKVAEKIEETDNAMSTIFEISKRSTTIMCPEKRQKYSMILEKKKTSFYKRKFEFKHGKVTGCRIKPIQSFENVEALTIMNHGLEIDLTKLQDGQLYILDIEYELDDDGFIDALVERNTPKETPDLDKGDAKYWMVAALKFPEKLSEGFYQFDINDLDFAVNVGVSHDLETKIPKIYRQQLEQLIRIAGPLGRDELFREYFKLRNMKQREYGKDSLKALGDLQELFVPAKFGSFVEVSKPFYYDSCQRGINELDLSMSWPRNMVVYSRTNLSLKDNVVRGYLYFKRDNFLGEVDKIFT